MCPLYQVTFLVRFKRKIIGMGTVGSINYYSPKLIFFGQEVRSWSTPINYFKFSVQSNLKKKKKIAINSVQVLSFVNIFSPGPKITDRAVHYFVRSCERVSIPSRRFIRLSLIVY